MSADNGIYILTYPKNGKTMARVIHAQAIENIEYDDGTEMDEDGHNIQILKEYFGNVEEMTFEEAQKVAFQMYEKIMKSDFPVLEYGISIIEKKVPFPE